MHFNFLTRHSGRHLTICQDGDCFYHVEDPNPDNYASTAIYRAEHGPKDDWDMEGAQAARDEFLTQCLRHNITVEWEI